MSMDLKAEPCTPPPDCKEVQTGPALSVCCKLSVEERRTQSIDRIVVYG